jgi:hypothetical protein
MSTAKPPVSNKQALKAAETLLAYYKGCAKRAVLNEFFDTMVSNLQREIYRIPARAPLSARRSYAGEKP